MRRFLEGLLGRLCGLYNTGTEQCSVDNEVIEHILEPENGVIFMRNLKAEEFLRNNSVYKIKEIKQEDRNNIRRLLEEGMINGQSPIQTALNLVGRIDPISKKRTGGIIGLSDYDNSLISTASMYLQELDKRYLNLKLRDKRFDRTVKKSIESTKPIPLERIERIIIAYTNRILQRRAEIIARTEIMKSINASEFNAHIKLVNEGSILENMITKEWDDCGDTRVRNSHAIMAQNYGKGLGIGIFEPFILPSGGMMLYPGDDSLGASAKEIIQCRCRVKYCVNWRERGE